MLTTKEAAQRLGISPRRVTALIEAGALKAEKFGRSWMIDEAAVQTRLNAAPQPGRPDAKASDGHDRFRYTLMSRTHPVLDFTYNFRTGEATGLEPREGLAFKPLGIGRLDRAPNRYDLAQWIRSRAIPGVRPNLPRALREMAVSSPAALMFESLGLSLSDPYWFKPEGLAVEWVDVNYFDNGYEETLGDLMLDGTVPAGKQGAEDTAAGGRGPAITHSPDTATNGMLGKTWVRRGGTDYLIKGGMGNENREPFNEKLATRLIARLLPTDEFVAYEVVERRGRAYSSCANMVTADTELIPAQDVLTAFAVTEGRDLHGGYRRALAELGVPHGQALIDKMIVVDHLMANFDRHTHNFGLIRNAATLDGYRVAPLFDHGCGFYSRATTAELEARPYSWESHPFREYPSQQLALVEDLSWYDPAALEGFMDDIAGVLGENPEIDERFIAAVQRQTARQINAVNALAAERGIVVAGW
ncbi:DNA-binding protein [uncultured Adlercreutzia sp.]|uniref:helix-turn-helix domain-containing protein n=1 Tax=uncultured Adlercreutzia sp. TaxID=875803 RepID=UPI0025ECCFBF|nr:DNA-binding protein [uncultured Adlercreutzia sp.]